MTGRAYPEYQSAPDAWMGDVPAHWGLERMKYGLTEKTTKKGPDLPPGAISYGKVVTKDAEKIAPETRATYQEVLAGEYLINPINLNYDLVSLRTALSEIDVCVSPAYIVLRAIPEKVHPVFGNYVLHVFDVCHMKTLGAGVRQTITFKDIGQCVWPLPTMDEQVAIANFLDRETNRIDGLIEKKTRFIALLKEKRAAVITHAVTKGIDPDAPMKDSGQDWLGRVPAHWEVLRIAALFREVSRPADPALPVLSVSIHDGVTDGELADEDRDRKVALSEDRTKYQGVAPGDLVYNMMRAWQGAFGAVTVKGLVSPAYVVAAPVTTFRTKFIEHLLHTKSAAEEIRRFSRGIADFRMRLYWDHFRALKVCLPPLEEQDRILSEIDTETARIDGLISLTERSIDLLREKRAALITAAVTGKIDVRAAA
jgi:type I restriction enzyme S subunit